MSMAALSLPVWWLLLRPLLFILLLLVLPA